ncbi:MAG TPA: replicative DNA helicase [Planctomycetes bacterium]|nr:replicative DNA helicase [Planctomycetota bacterium]HIL52235.1 replicative DNA helicase [Planctomycetota bacterium]
MDNEYEEPPVPGAELGRTPPHNIDAEQAVLGSLLINPSRMIDAVDYLRAEDFFSPRHTMIFEALVHLGEQAEAIDFITVGEALMARGNLERAGGREYLVELTRAVSGSAHLQYHAKLVRDTAVLRRLISAASEIIEQAYNTRPDGDSVSLLVDESENAIFQISDEGHSSGVKTLASALQETMKRIDSPSRHRGLVGLTSGFYDLDDKTAGFDGGQLIILAARPSMGKTALVLNMMDRAAASNPEWMEDGPPVILMFSLEMGHESVVERMLCTRAQVDAHKLKTGRIPPEDFAELARSADELSRLRLFIDDTPGLAVTTMRSRARRIKQREKGLHMIVVDYLQLMSQPKAESRQMEISQISRALKELSRELNVPVIALSQLSRAVESREDKRPLLSDLRESGSIEQDADIVMMLFRPWYYNETEENFGVAELSIGKQRNGPTGTVRLQFTGNTMRFENSSPSVAEPLVP